MALAETSDGGRSRALRFAWKAAKLILSIAVTFFGLLLVTFLIGRVVPVDPVLAVVGDRASQSTYDKVFLELGLDKPLWEQFLLYLQKMLSGSFGESLLTKKPIAEDIARVFPATLELASVAIIIGTVLGILPGVGSTVAGWLAVTSKLDSP